MNEIDLSEVIFNNDLDTFGQLVEERAARIAAEQIQSVVRQRDAEARALAAVLGEYPDLADQNSELAKQTRKEFERLEARGLDGPTQMEVAAARAWRRLGNPEPRAGSNPKPAQAPAQPPAVVDDNLRRMAKRMNNGVPVPEEMLKKTLERMNRR